MASSGAAQAASAWARLADGSSVQKARASVEERPSRASTAGPFAYDLRAPLQLRVWRERSASAASTGQADDAARQAGDCGGDVVGGDTATPVRLELSVLQDTLQPPTHRRMVGKQRPPWDDAEVLRVDVPDSGAADTENRSMYARCYGHLLRRKASSLREAARAQRDDSGALSRYRLGALRSMRHDSRVQAVQDWPREDGHADGELKSWLLASFQVEAVVEKPAPCREKWLLKGTLCVLLTWNGEWGHFTVAAVGAIAVLAIEELCERLRSDERVRAVEAALQLMLAMVSGMYYVQDLAHCLEDCTKTYEAAVEAGLDRCSAGGPVRVHARAFLRYTSKSVARSSMARMLCGSATQKSSHARGQKSRANSGQGLYYVQWPKTGQILSGGSLSPFKDYLVSGEWIMNRVQANKITYEMARLELVRSAKNLPRLLPALEKWKKKRNLIMLESRKVLAEQGVAALRKPSRHVPAVHAWLALFRATRMRYKFLVLEGPSCVGKTQFSSSLSPSNKFPEVHCSECVEPDLRRYDALLHDVILLDEATCQLVFRCKNLFQASLRTVILASSRANCHSYQVWVYHKQLIVSSNRWSLELAQL
ncbi:MAG: hypothetical protein EBV06_15695 [Planctomycetia bacterium]|nr:hypothetical protein [Planctomycetia bacterium]